MRLFFLLALITTVLGSSITNGTCYYKAGAEADEIYSPCGNTVDGRNWPCCQLGDKCNNLNTCTWDNGHDPIYTYVAGCTDPNYEDDSCPFKDAFSDYQWVGLQWAGCTVKNGKVNWDGCDNDGYSRVRVSNESSNCTCNDSYTPLLKQQPTGLVAMGYLPSSKMGEISWEAGYSRTDSTVPSTATSTHSSVSTITLVPATSVALSTTSSSSTGNPTTNGTSASTSATVAINTSNAAATTVPTNNGNSSDLSTGAKVGIGLSVSLLAVGAGAFLVFAALRFRKRHEAERQLGQGFFDNSPQDQEKCTPTPGSEPAMLDAESTQRDSTWSGQKSELPGSPTNPSVMSTVSPISTAPARNEDPAVVYRPFRYQSADMGDIAELPEERPSWSGVEYAAYKIEQGRNESTAALPSPRRRGYARDVHELPG